MTGGGRRGLAVLAAIVAVLAIPAVLWAHAHLIKSNPAANEQVATSPVNIRLWFSEAPELAFTQVTLLAPDSAHVPIGSPARDAESSMAVVVPIPNVLSPGRYTVVWRTAAADGHPSHGRFSFTVVSNAARATSSEGEKGTRSAAPLPPSPLAKDHVAPAAEAGEGTFDASSPAYVVVRWLSFTALLAIIGVTAFQWLVLGTLRRRGDPRDLTVALTANPRAAVIGAGAAVILGLVTVARLYAQSVAMYGAAETAHGSMINTMLLRTVWGADWIAQMAVVIIAVVGFLIARRASAIGWIVATIAAVLLAFAPAFAGHAIAIPHLTSLAILADGLHVLGAGGWLGSLLAVVVVGIPVALQQDAEHRGPAVAALVNAFSPLALGFAALVAVSGIVSAWLHLEHLSALWQSEYGRVLLIKLAVLSLVIASGAYNWLRVRPTLGDARGTVRIRRSAKIELLIGVAVLAVTAILVATPTPHEPVVVGAVVVAPRPTGQHIPA